MYIFASISLFTFVIYLVGNVITANIELIRYYRAQSSTKDLVVVSEALQQFSREKFAYPSTLTTLGTTAGFEYVQSSLNNWQGYSVSGTLTDSTWSYVRMAVFNFDKLKGATTTSYLNSNGCGSGAFGSASSWCGSVDSLWFRSESREVFNDYLLNQKGRQQRMLQKFAAYFNKNQAFPNKDQLSANLTAGNTFLLPTLVGYSGGASACSGTYTWMGIPIDCGEMFDQWGNAVGYAYFSDSHMAIVSTSPIMNSSGTKISVTTDLNVN